MLTSYKTMVDTEAINVQVLNPRTHLKSRWSTFTDYEIKISTNNRAFVLRNSCVRRRFSEVEWLKRTLEKASPLTTTLPPFPSKRKFIGRFNQDFLEKRRAGLEEFLTRLVNMTLYLSEAALHLFLQTKLTVKEIGRVLDGKDCRDITDFVSQQEVLDREGVVRRKSTANTNTDSGFSGSVNLDRHAPDCKLQCQSNHGNGNGWSSGCAYTNSPRKKKAAYKGRCQACRRKSLCRTASVLPSGQLVVAEDHQTEDTESPSSSSDQCHDEADSKKCNQYDADDETDTNILDYHIINIKTFRLKDWLANVKPFSDSGLLMSEDDCIPKSRTIPEYDVISVPCVSTSNNTLSMESTRTIKSKVQLQQVDTCELEKSDDSEYSVVHSTIGGLELGTSKQLYDSSSSLSSAGVYRTYDVVEMVEVK